MTTPRLQPPTRQGTPFQPTLAHKGDKEGGKSCLYWGDPKTGKTANACTWPSPLFLQLDLNKQTALNWGSKTPPIIIIEDPKELMDYYLPMIASREATEFVQAHFPELGDYKVETVVLDSYTSLCQKAQAKKPHKFNYDDWNDHRNMLMRVTRDLSVAGAYVEGLEHYNFVGTIHKSPERDDDSGRVLHIWPSVDGSFKKAIRQYFDMCLVTDVKHSTVIQGGKPSNKVEYIVHTAPPDKLHTGCGIGGQRDFPLTCEGDYDTLMSHWK